MEGNFGKPGMPVAINRGDVDECGEFFSAAATVPLENRGSGIGVPRYWVNNNPIRESSNRK